MSDYYNEIRACYDLLKKIDNLIENHQKGFDPGVEGNAGNEERKKQKTMHISWKKDPRSAKK